MCVEIVREGIKVAVGISYSAGNLLLVPPLFQIELGDSVEHDYISEAFL